MGGAAENAAKTHCLRGHAYDAINTYLNPRGWRECRACHRDRQARHLARKSSAPLSPPQAQNDPVSRENTVASELVADDQRRPCSDAEGAVRPDDTL